MNLDQIIFCSGVVMALFWTYAYVMIIVKGFKDKSYGMPVFALALNICWELIYAYVEVKKGLPNGYAYVVWFFLDVLIFTTYFKYGRDDFSKYFDKKYFIPWSFALLIMAFILQMGFLLELDHPMSAWYSAFLQNMLMSGLFISMIVTRKNLKGQALSIGMCKMIGSLFPTIVYGILLKNKLVLAAGVGTVILDVIYIGLIMYYKNKSTTTVK